VAKKRHNPTSFTVTSKATRQEAEYYTSVKDLSSPELGRVLENCREEEARLLNEHDRLQEALKVNRVATSVLTMRHEVLSAILTGRR
jgi:hypothetical protein